MCFVSPLARQTLRAALIATGFLSSIALLAGGIRLLPWMFDPDIPWRVAAPFARGLATVALESAFLIGWPLGWALACNRVVERGEWLALEALGERPFWAVARLVPQAIVLGSSLALVSVAWGRDASEPGRVVEEFINEAQRECGMVSGPRIYAVPFVDVTWLCVPSRAPRLVARAPGSLANTIVTATRVAIAGDFRRIVFADARATVGLVDVHAKELVLRGLSPWSRAATLRPASRAAVLVLAALLTSVAAAYSALGGSFIWFAGAASAKSTPRATSRFGAFLVGVSGPLATLGALRGFERTDADVRTLLSTPFVGLAATVLSSIALGRLSRRPRAASS
jgi:hypothetical protein